MKRVTIVGFGFMGGMHCQAYTGIAGAQLVALVDIDPSRVDAQVKRLGLKVPVFSSLKESLARVPTDVVDVCVPTDRHLEVVLEALAAGKDVFCEKPLAFSTAQAKAMQAAAKKAKRRFMTGHCIRFWPEYQAFEAFLKSKKAGKLKSLTLQRRSALPGHSAGNWLWQAKRSGGAALDLHIHDTDWVLHLLGKPKSVTSRGTKDSRGYSHLFTDYEYPGMVVRAEGGWNYPGKWGFQMAFQAVFEKGAVEYDSGAKPSLKLTLEGGESVPLAFQEPAAGESKSGSGNVSSLGGYFNELQYFIDCLEKNQAPKIATLDQAAETLRVTLAELKSAESGKRVAV
jgi:predicted dehydrogenase